MSLKRRNIKSLNDETPTGGGWEVIYTGFILILLCFFIMLSAFSNTEDAKVMKFVKSFIEAVSILPGSNKVEFNKAALQVSDDILENQKKSEKLYEDLKGLVEDHNPESSVKLFTDENRLVMRLSDTALFDTGAASISPEALPLLSKIGIIISNTSGRIRIEGHTDNIPIHTGKFLSNWELSTARAVSVLRYLIETHDISATRLSAGGFGEYHPVLPNDGAANRAKNRRVELIFHKEIEPQLQGKQ